MNKFEQISETASHGLLLLILWVFVGFVVVMVLMFLWQIGFWSLVIIPVLLLSWVVGHIAEKKRTK